MNPATPALDIGRPSGTRRILLLLVGLAAGWLLVGCGGTTGGPSTRIDEQPVVDQELWPADDGQLTDRRQDCQVLAAAAQPGGSFIVAVTDSVLPSRAPIPHNAGERLVFAHLYETLVRVDCAGRLEPGLARQWTCTEDSTVWVFTLRDDARFWDGSRITAKDVLQAWRNSQGCPRVPAEASPWNWFNSQSRSVMALDARRLAVRLPEPQARFPLLLAHPATAVAADRPGWTWPVGSGPCRLRAADPAPGPDLECRPNANHPTPPAWKQLVFRVLPGADPRDLASGDSDLVRVRQLEVVRFYNEVPGFKTLPLPWDRLYVLACPPAANLSGTDRWQRATAQLDPNRDLTLVTARRWPGIVFPASDRESCPQLSGPVSTGYSAHFVGDIVGASLDHETVVFPTGDEAARELAHRLVALGNEGGRAVSLSPAALASALQQELAGAFVLPESQNFPTACLQLAALLSQAAWLQERALSPSLPPSADTLGQARQAEASAARRPARLLLDDGWVQPLALTRPWLVVRGELAGLALDYDGTPRLAGLGRALTEPAP